MYEFLDRIDSPEDIKALDIAQLPKLCSEIRDYIVHCCAENPGHLASSLGAVEIITGLHYVLDCPKDKIIFDVGHQAYAHKILTGRRKAFASMRTSSGISGFPNISESPCDAFGTGHSSTSISAALGFAEAAKLQGNRSKVVAVIGDGALSGGLAFEGINNAAISKADLLVIINDNNQSIDKNLGGLHNHLLNLTTNPGYNRIKDILWDKMGETRARTFIQRWLRSLKAWFVKRTGGDLFEALGFRYFGPIDGNDIRQITEALSKITQINGPRVLHCISKKGKGYAPAEADPSVWHAPGRFNPDTGERIPSPHPRDRYQDVFGQVLLELAVMDSRIVGITPAMAQGCGMGIFAEKMPERFFDVGIEEEHAVTFSAGLAAGGMRPFCNIYSTFSQRAYDQIIHDVALQGLPVTLCFDRAGMVGEDGATHQGAFDLAAYRSIPGISIIAPRSEVELKNAMYTAYLSGHPYIIRYPRGMGEGTPWKEVSFNALPEGRGEILVEGNCDTAVLALGPCAMRASQAAEICRDSGEPVPYVCDMRFLKPIDEELLAFICGKCRKLITVEDGCIKGGLFGAVSEYVASGGLGLTITPLGIPDRFINQGTQNAQWNLCEIDLEGILKNIRKSLEI